MNLFKALSYKEWTKTKRLIQVVLALVIAITVYSYIELTYSMRINEAVNVWYNYIYQRASLSPLMMYLLPLAGISLAIVQYVPEMTNKRLKLTLHLPYSETGIVSSMLVYGYLVLILLFVFTAILLVVVMQIIMPMEIVKMMLWQLLPWMIGGISGYGLVAWVCIEPQWKQRIMNIVVTVVILSVLFLTVNPEAYSNSFTGLIVISLLSFIFPFHSFMRFKQGIQ